MNGTGQMIYHRPGELDALSSVQRCVGLCVCAPLSVMIKSIDLEEVGPT